MIPRTVKVAAAVKSTLTTPQYLNYGNVILNGYLTTASGVATAGATGAIASLTISNGGTNYTNGTYTGVMLSGGNGSWAYANITVAGGIVTVCTITTGGSGFVVGQVLTLGAIPRTAAGTNATVTVATVNTRKVSPVLKGWTTNYSSYYTELAPAAPYTNTYPGMDAGGFEYIVHSFKPPTGPIASIGFSGPQGYGYTDGVYTNVPTVSGPFGSGATLNIVVAGGQVQSVTLNNPGTGYRPGSTLTPVSTAVGTVTGISLVSAGGGYPRATVSTGNPTTTITGSGSGLVVDWSTAGGPLGPKPLAFVGINSNPGSGGINYAVGDTASVPGGSPNAIISVTSITPTGVTTPIGPGSGFFVVIGGVSPVSLNGNPYWSQRPVNAQSQVNSLFPLPGGGGGWIYPVADSAVPPPIDTL